MKTARSLSQRRIARGVFVTGTDTGVGKTVVSGLLGHYLAGKGYKVITQKWVQTGKSNFTSDVDQHLKLMNIPKARIQPLLGYISGYTFNFAGSPHLVASLEGKKISPAKIKKNFNYLAQRFDFIVVEGTGGVLVPLNRNRFLIDIAAQLRLPTIIVADNKLGTINHTLLTVEALKQKRLNNIGIVFINRPGQVNKIILDDNLRIIKELSKQRSLGILPWIKDRKRLYKAFAPIGENIFKRLNKRVV